MNKIENLSKKEKDKIKCVDNFASILKKTITNSSEDIDENKIQKTEQIVPRFTVEPV